MINALITKYCGKFFVITSVNVEVIWPDGFVCYLFVCLYAVSCKTLCMDLLFLPTVGLGPVSSWFHSGGDLYWPSLSFRGQVAEQGHFDIKWTVAQKR